MGLLTDIFHLISSALLIPTMLLLLWCLARALIWLGQTLREAAARAKDAPAVQRLAADLDALNPAWTAPGGSSVLATTLARVQLAADDPMFVERLLHEAELTWDRRLEPLRNLIRLGPMFGLMGTLIPLGPALMGLANGDLQTMASNLIVAFATTVVGLVSAGIALIVLSVKRGWYRGDALLLQYAGRRTLQSPPALRSPVRPPDAVQADAMRSAEADPLVFAHSQEFRHAAAV